MPRGGAYSGIGQKFSLASNPQKGEAYIQCLLLHNREAKAESSRESPFKQLAPLVEYNQTLGVAALKCLLHPNLVPFPICSQTYSSYRGNWETKGSQVKVYVYCKDHC